MKQNLRSLRIDFFRSITRFYRWRLTKSDESYHYSVFSNAPHFAPIVQLLSKLPPALEELKLIIPHYDSVKDKRTESILLVKHLIKILSEKKGDSKLQSIVLDKIKLCNQNKNHLLFMFGYNNNIHIQGNDKYHLYFDSLNMLKRLKKLYQTLSLHFTFDIDSESQTKQFVLLYSVT